MFSKSLGRQGSCLTLAAFVPAAPPALDILSFTDSDLSHNIESIVILRGQIKRRNEVRDAQNSIKMETRATSFWDVIVINYNIVKT
jgi:hypothetical protein